MLKSCPMKVITFLIMVTYFGNALSGQSLTVDSIIHQRIDSLLIQDDILSTKPHGREQKLGDAQLRKLLQNVYPRTDLRSTPIINELHVSTVNISEMGSIFFTGYANKNTFNNAPSVAIRDNIKEIGLINPNRSSYELNINSSYLMSKVLTLGGEVNSSYINSKAALSLKKTGQQHVQLSFAVGTFENKLGTLFNEVNLGNYIDGSDWLPLYDVWVQENSIPTGTVVLWKFKALSIYENRNAELESGQDVGTTVNAQYKIPLLSTTSKAEYSWKETNEVNFRETAFDFYFLETIGLGTTVEKVPSSEQILACWSKFNGSRNQPKIEAGFTDVDQPITIHIEFGPIPEKYKNDVKLDTILLKESLGVDKSHLFKLGEGDLKITPIQSLNNGMYVYEISISVNDQYLRAYSSTTPIEARITLRLFFNKASAAGKFLECKFENVPINISSYPYPSRVDINSTPISTTSNISMNRYSWDIRFQVSKQSGLPTSNVNINKVEFEDLKYKYLEDQFIPSILIDPIGGTYSYPVTFNILPNSINLNETIKVFFYVNFKEGGTSYTKKLQLFLDAPSNQNQSNTSVLTIESIDTLKDLIYDQLTLSNGLKFSEILSNKDLSTEDLISLFKSEFNIEIHENGFLINTKYLDKQKLKNYLNK